MARILGPDAKSDPEAVLLVDVGGNKGHEVASFHGAHPDHTRSSDTPRSSTTGLTSTARRFCATR